MILSKISQYSKEEDNFGKNGQILKEDKQNVQELRRVRSAVVRLVLRE